MLVQAGGEAGAGAGPELRGKSVESVEAKMTVSTMAMQMQMMTIIKIFLRIPHMYFEACDNRASINRNGYSACDTI